MVYRLVLFYSLNPNFWMNKSVYTYKSETFTVNFFSFYKGTTFGLCVSVVSEADKTYGDLSVAENTTDDQLSFLPCTHIKNCHLVRGFSWVVFFFYTA